MYNLYLDAIAMVRKMGRPDFFITFTANPAWKEILESLGPNQRAADRPDLVARVFHIKLQALLDDLTKKAILGRVIAWTYVVEFQKRGLPHAHILLIMHPEDKPRTPADIDARTCAELPPNTDGNQEELLEIVTRCMLHGPCGVRNPGAACMQADGCKAHYPKDFRDETCVLADTYPLYRRRDTGAEVIKGNCIMNNRDVVPYCPFLTKKYGAHINVEVVSSIRLVKYMYKYVYKGHDRANVDLADAADEIKAHIDARWVGPAEAVWRLLEFPLHGSSHSTQRLAVHLPGENQILFEEGGEVQANCDVRRHRSTLTAWFELNKNVRDSGSDELGILATYYHDIPSKCVWDRSAKAWKTRSRIAACKVIGRLANVAPTEGERYYLFLLLLAQPGACGFEHLRTVEGELLPTFQAAATARGLCDSDEHYHAALRDVLAVATAARARRFLAMILTCCEVADPFCLWDAFASELREDFRVRYPDVAAEQLALQHLQECLARSGKTTADYGLPLPRAFNADAHRTRELRAERNYDPAHEESEAARMAALMRDYPEQLHAYLELVRAFDNREAAVFFVDGPGGSGKSFLFEAFLHYARGRGEIAAACAWSGLAATLLPGGRTCHARFGFPVPLPREDVPWSVTAATGRGQVLIQCSVLVWDEIGTASAAALDAADACMRDLRQCDEPFGGALVLLGGDLRQTLPVMELASRAEIVAGAVTQSKLWKSGCVRRLRLTQNRRAALDDAYRAFLLEVGEGRVPYDMDVGPCSIALPPTMSLPAAAQSEDLIRFVYNDILQVTYACVNLLDEDNIRRLASRCILTPRNDWAGQLNESVLTKFPEDTIVELQGTTKLSGATAEDLASYPAEYLQYLDVPGLPPSTLRLCPGALVMLLRNLDYEDGLCNGTRCLVIAMSPRALDVLVLTGVGKGKRAFLPRIPMSPAELTLPVKIVRRQFPVRLAWAATINKAQGQSLLRPLLSCRRGRHAHSLVFLSSGAQDADFTCHYRSSLMASCT